MKACNQNQEIIPRCFITSCIITGNLFTRVTHKKNRKHCLCVMN
uniref:Uncharacterized protein n=1 Tax=Arundo donax TaxID=35708 RepID=A0A0A9G0X6_ARUDO